MGFAVEDRYLRLPTSTTLKVLYLLKKENQTLRGKLSNASTYLWFQSTELSTTICDWSAWWSVAGAQYTWGPIFKKS